MFLHFENGVLLYGTPSVHDIRDDFLDTQTRSLMVTLEECRSISMPHLFGVDKPRLILEDLYPSLQQLLIIGAGHFKHRFFIRDVGGASAGLGTGRIPPSGWRGTRCGP